MKLKIAAHAALHACSHAGEGREGRGGKGRRGGEGRKMLLPKLRKTRH
jgi:hypothetical protein